eukprot:TRINITY_DN29355_c0_g1_i1.p1 TRINITY_DN29355_c0_g1~~TRINITY_DN29355_c0_g1_i1.p1  ORF type:complete len:507 (-),score=75.46 TRINITY_DN29355_c0_g1_i1:387-1907(-)
MLLSSTVALLMVTGAYGSVGNGIGVCTDDAPQHSGYLTAGAGAEYFYYLAQSRSRTPESDPLVLWMTGGPGCSSVLALLIENGPCRVEGRSGSAYEMQRNPYSWNEVANVVWVDQPIGVGYSTPGKRVDGTEKEVAENMIIFLQAFYAKFPHFLDVPLFITGESYGGHYIPAVATRVLRQNGRGVGQLAGVAIGNGLVDPTVQFASKPDMAFTGGTGSSLKKGVVDAQSYAEMKKALPACEAGIRACQKSVPPHNGCLESYVSCVLSQVLPVQATGKNPYDLRRPCETIPNPADPVSGMCYNISLQTQFLNEPSVKARLGVPPSRRWTACNLTLVVPFIVSGDELMSYRKNVLELLRADVQVLVYAGDTDFMVDWVGCRNWVANLPWEHQKDWLSAPNEPFVLHNRSRGMKQSAYGLTFLQLYDSGHMVPMDQPEVALQMLADFIKNAPLRTTEVLLNGSSPHQDLSRPILPAVLFIALGACIAAKAFKVGRASARRDESAYHLLA